jgi:hypothetical protein
LGWVKSAKLIILQDAADITDTQTQIEIGAFATAIPAAINTDYPLAEPKYWKYESAKWDPTPTFTLGFTVGIQDDKETYKIGIQEASDAAFTSNVTTLAASQVTVNTEAVTYYESSAFTPTNNYFYRLVYQGDDNKDELYFYNAKVIATQSTSVSKLQTEYLLINEAQTDTGLQEYQTYYDLAEWDDGAGGLPTFHHEHSANSASSNTKLVAVDANLEDSDNQSIGGQRTYDAVAQSFTGAGFDLISCKFVLSKLGTPTGNCYAKLYAHSGTYGTSSVPTGSALATSDAFDVSTLSSTPTWHELSFSTPYTLVDGTKYCIVAEFTGGNNINYIYVRYKNSDVHEGNFSRRVTSGGSWSSQSSWDVAFMAFAEITNSDITGDDLTRGSSALTMPTSAKEIDA